MTQYISIPVELFTDPAFGRLGLAERNQLIMLYYLFGTIPYFIIDTDAPNEFGATTSHLLSMRIHALRKAGFLIDVDRNCTQRCRYITRKLTFKYQTKELEEAA